MSGTGGRDGRKMSLAWLVDVGRNRMTTYHVQGRKHLTVIVNPGHYCSPSLWSLKMIGSHVLISLCKCSTWASLSHVGSWRTSPLRRCAAQKMRNYLMSISAAALSKVRADEIYIGCLDSCHVCRARLSRGPARMRKLECIGRQNRVPG